MIDIADVVARLDADEKLMLTYKVPTASDSGDRRFDLRESVLLDVSEDAKLFYVKEVDEIVWVTFDEAVSVNSAE